MSDEIPRRRSSLWIIGCMVIIAWVACGTYRRQVPPQTTVRAVLQVPSATDLGTLCQRSETLQAAVDHLRAEGDIFITFDKTAQPRLSGKLTANKLRTIPSAGTSGPTPAAEISTETWELSYRTPQSERALGELHAIIAVIQQLVVPASSEKSAVDERSDAQIAQLTKRQQALRQKLDADSAETDSSSQGAIQLATRRECVQSLQRALTESRVQRLQSEEEWRLVEQEIGLKQRLDAVAAKLSAGPIQEAVLQIDRQRKLSAELTRLNDMERRLGNVYGEKHPKLMEVRQKFEQILSDLGGWDHVLDEPHVAERLQTALAQLMHLKQQHEADLETQLELEQLELTSLTESTERRETLSSQLEQIDRELTQATQATTGTARQASAFAVQQSPEVIPQHWSDNLAFLFAVTTAGGVILGMLLHRFRSNPVYYEPDEPHSPPSVAVYTPLPEAQLNLAQRRAMRQARLQQAYAA